MRWLRLILAVLGIVLASVLLAAIVLINVDLGRFKGEVEELASTYTGRQLTIGTLSVELGKQLRIVADDVRFASWPRTPDLLSAQHLRLTIDTWSLFSEFVVVESFNAHGVHLNLAVGTDGEANWVLDPVPPDASDTATLDDSDVGILLRQTHVSDLQVTYQTAQGLTHAFDSPSIDLHESESGTLRLHIDGALNGTAVSVEGNAGPFENILNARGVDFDLHATVGEIEMRGVGHIDDLNEPRAPELQLDLHGPNAEYLTDVLNVEPVTTGPFELSLSMGPKGGTTITRIDGTYGEFQVNSRIDIADLRKLSDFNVVLAAGGPSIATVAILAGRSDLPALPFKLKVAAHLSGSILTVEQFLIEAGTATLEATADAPHFPGIRGARGSIEARGQELGTFNELLSLPDQPRGPFAMNATLTALDAGAASVEITALALGTTARVTGTLTSQPDLLGSDLNVEVRGDDASTIASTLGVSQIPAQAFAVQADLHLADQGVEINAGSANLGPDRLEFAGLLGRDLAPEQTLVTVSLAIDDLRSTLAATGVQAQAIPAGTLRIDATLARDAHAFVIEDLQASLDTTQLNLRGRIGNSMTLHDNEFAIEIKGRNIAGLTALDTWLAPNTPFRLVGNIAFTGDDTVILKGLNANFGDATARGLVRAKLSESAPEVYITIDADGPSLGAIINAAADYLPEADAFSISGAGHWRQGGIRLDNTTVRVGNAELNIHGEVQAPPHLGAGSMNLRAHLPNLQILQFLTQYPLPAEALSISAMLGSADEQLRLSEVTVTLGRSKLQGTASYQAENDNGLPAFAVEANAEYLDLRPLQAVLPAAATDDSAIEPRERVIPDTPLPIAWLHSMEGVFDLAAEQIDLDNARARDVVLAGTLADGALRISQFALSAERGTLGGSGEVIASPRGVDVRVQADGSALTYGLRAEADNDLQTLPAYELALRTTASGSTISELAGTANGSLRLVSGPGRLEFVGLGILGRDFAREVVSAVNPFSKDEPYSNVECMAVVINATDGVLSGNPAVVLQTFKLNAAGIVEIDLATEAISARFHSQARKGIGIRLTDLAAPFTEVGGTLRNPRLKLDKTSTLMKGGMAVVTSGLLLARRASKRLFSDPHPCETAVRLADQALEAGPASE